MTDEFNFLRNEDLENNPSARIAVCLCLDTSGSMDCDGKIQALNAGVSDFFDFIRSDETTMYAAEVAIVSFGEQGVKCIRDFSSLIVDSNPPVLTANGGTPMGEAVNMALDRLEARKRDYKNKGVDYYQPMLVIMSDGQSNGSLEELSTAKSRTHSLIQSKKLTVLSIGVGPDADMECLSDFSKPKRKALRLKGIMFREFFVWLGMSVSIISHSAPGETVSIPPVDDWAEGWGTLD